jgi:hypothetical protein
MPRAFGIAPFVLFVAAGCTGNHDLLAVGGDGGASGSGGRANASGGDAASVAPVDSGSTGGAPSGPTEPSGPRKLTILHGVTDAPSIDFCFVPVVDGGVGVGTGAPEPAGGLSYGASFVPALSGIDLVHVGVRPYVVAADPSALAGFDCAALIALAAAPPVAVEDASVSSGFDASSDGAAGPRDAAPPRDASRDGAPPNARDASPPSISDASTDAADAAPPPIPSIRVSALPVIPAGALADERAYLLALGGCIGGIGVVDPSARSVCGSSYTPAQPTLTPTVVRLSRILSDGRVGLQFLNATPAVDSAALRVMPSKGSPIPIASNIVPGELRPTTPFATQTSGELGALDPAALVQILPSGTSTPAYSEPWSTSFGPANIGNLVDGADYALVLVGPYPGFTKNKWWNAPLVAIVESAP